MTDETQDPTFQTIQRIISQVAKISPADVLLGNPVTGLTNVDSIVLLEIVAKTELTLDIEIDEAELFDIDTVSDFVRTCRRLVAAAA